MVEALMTLREVSELLHVHHNTVRRWVADGCIKCYRLNTRGDLRFKPSDIDAFLASNVGVKD